jgi:hypothetical protein
MAVRGGWDKQRPEATLEQTRVMIPYNRHRSYYRNKSGLA